MSDEKTCSLCRRPAALSPGNPGHCWADAPSAPDHAAADCRSRALTVAALVAPVVEAAEELRRADVLAEPGVASSLARSARHRLRHAIDAMRGGLRELRGGS